jgi:hypothetical protein
MTDQSMNSAPVADVNDRYYATQLRPVRWLCGGVFVGLLALLAVRIEVDGIQASLEPGYLTVGFLEGFLLAVLLRYATPGPARLEISDGLIRFVYGNGRSLNVALTRGRARLRLAERVEGPEAKDSRTDDGALYFALVGARRIALTPLAFDMISKALARAGFSFRARDSGDPAKVTWRVREYTRPRG